MFLCLWEVEMYMEIEFERLSGGYRFDVLEDASSRVDGSRVWKNDEGVAVLYCENEDAVWNVWRAAGALEEEFREGGATGIGDAAEAVQEEINALFGE
jgi:hypothetical protein